MARPVVSQFKSPETRKIYDDAARFRAKIGLGSQELSRYEERLVMSVRRNDVRTGHRVLDELERRIRSLEFEETSIEGVEYEEYEN